MVHGSVVGINESSRKMFNKLKRKKLLFYVTAMIAKSEKRSKTSVKFPHVYFPLFYSNHFFLCLLGTKLGS